MGYNVPGHHTCLCVHFLCCQSLSPICFSCFAIVYPWFRAKYNIEFDFYCVSAPPPPIEHPLNYTGAVQRWELTHIWECLSGLQWPEGWAQRGVCSVLYHITYRMLQAQDSGQGFFLQKAQCKGFVFVREKDHICYSSYSSSSSTVSS